MMINGEVNLSLNLNPHPESPHELLLQVDVPAESIEAIYEQALKSIKQDIHTYGFGKGETPESYIALTYKPLLINHISHFFVRHYVNAFLHKGISEQKIITLSSPHPFHMQVEPGNPALFTFKVNTTLSPLKNEWKKLHFKAPERKNYKDLDRQVEFFLKEEEAKQKEAKNNPDAAIEPHDWICLSVHIVDPQHNPLFNLEQKVWIKIGEEEADRQAQNLFIGKKVGDSFITDHDFFQDTVSDTFMTHYLFKVTILYHISSRYFEPERFKTHFRLKSGKDMHQKLIEVFSYRHDISQRRETIEKLFKLLFHHYPVTIPPAITQLQEKSVLSRVQENPDYHVYKNKPNFKDTVKLLAEKQIKEMLFIDSIAYQENIQATDEDLINYLNLFKRPRTKEFIYFDMPYSRLHDQEILLCHEELKRACQREKTLNYVIYYLTKKS